MKSGPRWGSSAFFIFERGLRETLILRGGKTRIDDRLADLGDPVKLGHSVLRGSHAPRIDARIDLVLCCGIHKKRKVSFPPAFGPRHFCQRHQRVAGVNPYEVVFAKVRRIFQASKTKIACGRFSLESQSGDATTLLDADFQRFGQVLIKILPLPDKLLYYE